MDSLPPIDPGDVVISERDFARLASFSLSTARRLRWINAGPRYLRLSPGRIGYMRRDVLDWLNRRRAGAAAA